MLKNVIKIFVVFVVGIGGGIFADQILWPYFIERPLFYKYHLGQTPIYLTERKELTMYVQENVALRTAVEKVEKVAVGVKTETLGGKILQGSGLVVTSDGLIVTLAELVPQGSVFYFYVDGRWPPYQILKRDLQNNLALIKIEAGGLSTAGFADLAKMKPGERVFLVGTDFSTSTPQKTVNEGIVSFFGKDLIQTNIFEKPNIVGSPLFNIEGNVIGLSTVDREDRISVIPIAIIRQFIGI